MKEERMKILKMLADKKITPDEAAQLLEALDKTATGTVPKAKCLRVHISDRDSSEEVNVNIPLGWVKSLSGFIIPKIEEKLKAKGYPFNSKDIMDSIATGQTRKIVDIKDGNDKVEIYIE